MLHLSKVNYRTGEWVLSGVRARDALSSLLPSCLGEYYVVGYKYDFLTNEKVKKEITFLCNRTVTDFIHILSCYIHSQWCYNNMTVFKVALTEIYLINKYKIKCLIIFKSYYSCFDSSSKYMSHLWAANYSCILYLWNKRVKDVASEAGSKV